MFSKIFLAFFIIVFVFSFSNSVISQPIAYDTIVQANARKSFVISANEPDQYNWGNCYSKFPRKLLVIEVPHVVTMPWAVFSGGVKVGSSWMDDYGGGTCQGLYGYATVRQWVLGDTTQMSDTITVTFTPKKISSISIVGKPLQNYVITLDGVTSRTYIAPNTSNFRRLQITEAVLDNLGFSVGQLSNVSTISVRAVDADWVFAVNGIRLSERDNGGGDPIPAPPVPTIDNPVVFVPGVAGSELKEADVKVRWLSPSVTTMTDDLEALKLPSNRNIFATDVLRGLPTQNYFLGGYLPGYKPNFYEGLLKNFLIESQNLKEYNVLETPAFRTTAGCDLRQKSDNPNLNPKLFVFAYDWRQNNTNTAVALKDYIGCVKKFYPNKKVRIITHSMGSLVARRYALLYPNDNDVDKIITIAGPWLGAPKGIYSLETGSFIASSFGADAVECLSQTAENKALCIAKWGINKTYASSLRESMITFPGPLQLLPSWYYYRLQESDTGSSYLSVRESIWGEPVDYNFADATNWLNERHEIQPGDLTRDFHMSTFRGLQDDWRQDTGNIKFYHIYGQQNRNLSVGKVKYKLTTYCSSTGSLNCVGKEYFEPEATNGDGTVPLYSSRRISTQYNFNSGQAKRYIEDARTRPLIEANRNENDSTEHTKLTENSRVQKRISQILLNNDGYSGSDATVPDTESAILPNLAESGEDAKVAPTAEKDSFYVSLHNVTGYHLGRGPTSADFSTASGLNGSQAIPIGDKAVWLGLPATGGYYVSFYGDGTPMKVQIVRGLDYNRVQQLVQYIDLVIPAGKVARLYLSEFGLPQLEYDSDNNGTFETGVDYTVFLENNNAKDLEAPVVAFDYQIQGGGKLVTLSAKDNLSGVRKIYYSFNGQQFNEYMNPVTVETGQNLFVFAEDNNRNRTGIGKIDVDGTTYSIGNRVWFDVNNDGKINKNRFPEEVGATGVSVSLFADTNGDGQPDNIAQPLKTIGTSIGYYRFNGLSAGNYVVRINPSNFADNGVLQGYLNTAIQTADDTDSDAVNAGENGVLPNGQRNNVQNTGVLSGSITLGPNLSEPVGETDISGSDKGEFDKYANLTVDFGFYRLGLSGTVWNDTGNRNGFLDDGENGLANYRVNLFQASGEVPVGTDGILGTSDDANGGVLTDLTGDYRFQGLEEGDYSVKVTRQFAVASPQTSANPNDNADFDNNGSLAADSPDGTQISSPQVTISPANRGLSENTRINEFAGITENPTLDFGLFFAPTAANATVSGKIVNRRTGGINLATVTITATAGNFVKTVRTNQFGNFNFADIPAGNDYIITVSHKRYMFNSKFISVDDSISGLVIGSNN